MSDRVYEVEVESAAAGQRLCQHVRARNPGAARQMVEEANPGLAVVSVMTTTEAEKVRAEESARAKQDRLDQLAREDAERVAAFQQKLRDQAERRRKRTERDARKGITE